MSAGGKFFDTPDPGGDWTPAGSMSDRELTWRGRIYDLANTADVQELLGELDDVDDDAIAETYVAQQLHDAAVRTVQADARADEMRRALEDNTAKARLHQAVNDATGVTAAHEAFAAAHDPDKLLTAWQKSHGSTRTTKPTVCRTADWPYNERGA